MIPLREISPYLSVFGPVAGIIAVFDFIIKDEHKAKIFNLIASITSLSQRPLSLAFYGFTVIASTCSTVFIAYTASLVPHARGESILIGLKSSGPVLLAIVAKIIILDYILAIKTYLLLVNIPKFRQRAEEQGRSKFLTLAAISYFIFTDLYVTGMVTGFFLNWWESFQLFKVQPAIEASKVAPTISDFFNSMNFMVKDTVERSYYALNGALFMYFLSSFSRLGNGFLSVTNIESMQKNLFKIIAATLLLCVLIVVACRLIADAQG